MNYSKRIVYEQALRKLELLRAEAVNNLPAAQAKAAHIMCDVLDFFEYSEIADAFRKLQ